MSIVLVTLSLAAYGISQTLQTRKAHTLSEIHKLTFSRLAAAAKMSLRDSAEFPLSVDLNMVAINTSGRTLKKDHGTATYDFHGYNPRSGNGTGTFKRISTNGLFHSTKWVQPVALNSFVATFALTFFLSNDVNLTAKYYSLDGSEPSTGSQFVTARMSPHPGVCVDFKWSTKRGTPKTYCGTGQFKASERRFDLAPLFF